MIAALFGAGRKQQPHLDSAGCYRGSNHRYHFNDLGTREFWSAQFSRAADPTTGGLVTKRSLPAFVRHPIYTAGCLFGWAGVLCHLSALSVCMESSCCWVHWSVDLRERLL